MQASTGGLTVAPIGCQCKSDAGAVCSAYNLDIHLLPLEFRIGYNDIRGSVKCLFDPQMLQVDVLGAVRNSRSMVLGER
jgi:hypothetical protein